MLGVVIRSSERDAGQAVYLGALSAIAAVRRVQLPIEVAQLMKGDETAELINVT